MKRYIIKGKYLDLGTDKIDEASTEKAAIRLLEEYRMAFGRDWHLWIEEVNK
jgi:trans-2-enoyl-CoA reductase